MQKLLIAIGAAVVLVAGIGGYLLLDGTKPPTVATTAPGDAPPAPSGEAAAKPELYPDDRILGAADAPVTIIEYASLTCPHCAAFHIRTLPAVKSNYLDKGLARLVYRDFPLDQIAARASLLAQCVPGEGYFDMLDILFRGQQDWAFAQDPIAALAKIGRTVGLDQASIDKCLADEKAIDRIAARMEEAQKTFEVRSTPTFIIDGTKVSGAVPFEDYEADGVTKPGFDKLIKDRLPKS